MCENPVLEAPISILIVSVDKMLEETVEDAEGNLMHRVEGHGWGMVGTFLIDMAGKKRSSNVYIV